MFKSFIKLYNKVNYWTTVDRIGPDIPLTHWNLYFTSRMYKLCSKKFYRFDRSSSIRPGSYIVGCSQISIGKNVVIRPGCMFHGESESLEVSIIIEDDVLIGSGVHIYVENHSFEDKKIPIINQGHSNGKNVTIKRGSWIGANSILLPGVTIGENSVVGAGSIVTKSVHPFHVVAGAPAKTIKIID